MPCSGPCGRPSSGRGWRTPSREPQNRWLVPSLSIMERVLGIPERRLMMPAPNDTPHLEPDQVVAYIEHALPVMERERVEDHLSRCEECTAELAEVVRLQPRSVRHVAWLRIGAAAAAVVAGVLFIRPLVQHPASSADVERQGQAGTQLRIVAPTAGGRVSGAVRLIWHAARGASVYRVTLSSSDGDSVWAGSTTDTTLAIP